MVSIELRTTNQVVDALDKLVETGYFGRTRAEAAEQLLREKLRELIRDKESK